MSAPTPGFMRNRPELTPAEKDAIRRMMDNVNLHVQARRAAAQEGSGPIFIAIKLADGSSDGTVYETRRDAERFMANRPDDHFVLAVGMDSMPFREAALVMMQHRAAHAAGVRFSSTELVTPQLTELLAPYLPRTLGAL